MSGQDAQFIYDERPNEPQHTLKISILGPEASAAWSFEDAKRDLSLRLSRLEPLQWRALRVPLDLHHPVWIPDPHLDLDWHVRRLAVPGAGGRDELCAVISEILSIPLDPTRPLWEMWWIEGYEGGVVSVLKMSHALADGAASRRLLELIHTPEPGELPYDASRLPALPSRRRLLRDALMDRVRGLARIPGLLRATLRFLMQSVAARRADSTAAASTPSALAGPSHRLGGRLSRRRSFHFFSVPLDTALSVRRSLGCTVNDVIVAAVSGGVRSWLMERGELPGLATRGFMPASIRGAGEADLWGNRITVRPIDLPTHVDDPLARLRAVQQETLRAKEEVKLREGTHLEDWIRWLPPSVGKALGHIMRAYVRAVPNQRFPGSVAISNVAGPAECLSGPWGVVENTAAA
jgi:WS/DGAT/MGAT family acyltransferase